MPWTRQQSTPGGKEKGCEMKLTGGFQKARLTRAPRVLSEGPKAPSENSLTGNVSARTCCCPLCFQVRMGCRVRLLLPAFPLTTWVPQRGKGNDRGHDLEGALAPQSGHTPLLHISNFLVLPLPSGYLHYDCLRTICLWSRLQGLPVVP